MDIYAKVWIVGAAITTAMLITRLLFTPLLAALRESWGPYWWVSPIFLALFLGSAAACIVVWPIGAFLWGADLYQHFKIEWICWRSRRALKAAERAFVKVHGRPPPDLDVPPSEQDRPREE